MLVSAACPSCSLLLNSLHRLRWRGPPPCRQMWRPAKLLPVQLQQLEAAVQPAVQCPLQLPAALAPGAGQASGANAAPAAAPVARPAAAAALHLRGSRLPAAAGVPHQLVPALLLWGWPPWQQLSSQHRLQSRLSCNSCRLLAPLRHSWSGCKRPTGWRQTCWATARRRSPSVSCQPRLVRSWLHCSRPCSGGQEQRHSHSNQRWHGRRRRCRQGCQHQRCRQQCSSRSRCLQREYGSHHLHSGSLHHLRSVSRRCPRGPHRLLRHKPLHRCSPWHLPSPPRPHRQAGRARQLRPWSPWQARLWLLSAQRQQLRMPASR